MNRFLIVDGSNLLFQMFFGMPARIVNSRGKAIQGTLGFVGALLKILRRIKPDCTVVIFDGEHENSRLSLDPEYKSNRPDYSELPEEETPFSQLGDIKAALDYMGIRHLETTSCEADDLIASYALSAGEHMEVIISSWDSDFFQLLSPTVSVLRYRGEKTLLCTPEYLREKLQIAPEQYADFKSLTGDTADHIRGADKIGPKTAAQLLHEFGTLERLLAHAERIQKPSVRESVLQSRERLQTNYRLIKLGNTVPLPLPLSEFKSPGRELTTNEVLAGIHLK